MSTVKWILLILLLLPVFASAEQTKTIFNPFTGNPDFITRLDTTTLLAGTGISISCTNGVCTITNTGGGGTFFILMEDSTAILAEDGTKLLTE